MCLSKYLKPVLVLVLTSLFVVNCRDVRAARPEGGIVITILEGEGALNDIRQRTAREPIVQVDDENHRPIAGAAVVFLLPDSGPGGSFAGGASKMSAVTDSSGRASAEGLQPNNVAGSFEIQVIVTVAGQTAQATIHQQNVAKVVDQTGHNGSVSPSSPVHIVPVKVILITVGAVAVTGTVIGIIVTRGGSPTAITAGPPTVGPPAAIVNVGIRIPLHFRSH